MDEVEGGGGGELTGSKKALSIKRGWIHAGGSLRHSHNRQACCCVVVVGELTYQNSRQFPGMYSYA